MATLTQRVRQLLGEGRAPTRKGWWNFCHRRCGDRRFRLGVHFRRGRYRCFNCGAQGDLKDLLPDVARTEYAALSPDQRAPRPPADGLPWRPIPAEGRLSPLARAAVAYLDSRGVPRGHAARLGLGYGVEGRWVGRVIHPYYDDRGALAGWQGRLTFDPEKGAGQKTLFPSVGEIPAGLTRLMPQEGALYLIDRVPRESPVIVTEGPYDAIHAERVAPAVALFGSVLFDAQVRRLLTRRPSIIYLGLDRDKSAPLWSEIDGRWLPDPRLEIARTLYQRTDAPVMLVEYPDDFEGDWGGRADKSPHTTEALTRLLEGARRFRPGATARRSSRSRPPS